jgi:hypothetical protein
VTQASARKLLREFGINELDRGYDCALRNWCDGVIGGIENDMDGGLNEVSENRDEIEYEDVTEMEGQKRERPMCINGTATAFQSLLPAEGDVGYLGPWRRIHDKGGEQIY